MKALSLILAMLLSTSVIAQTITVKNSDGSNSTIYIPPDSSSDWANKVQ